MPASTVVPLRRAGEYCLLEAALPGRPVEPAGILLLDPQTSRLYLRVRPEWQSRAEPEDAEVLELLAEDLRAKAAEMGGAACLEWLEDRLSHTLRLGRREAVAVDAFTRVLDRLYQEHVEELAVLPFRTHLPLYSLRAAAGRFGEDVAVEEEDWVRAPESLRLDQGMFMAHVAGRSMEPRIPDGSLNVFRAPVVGSRQGRLVLVEMFGALEESARYTIKRYTSRKTFAPTGEWRHASIRLEPLNPEFEAFELEDGAFRVIAEWVATLE